MRFLLAAVVLLDVSLAWPAEAEKPLASRIAQVGLFKNGLAFVHRTVQVEGPGVYRIEDAPQPVHGTYWIESDAKVATRVTYRVVEVPVRRNAGDFQEELAGQTVSVYFAEPNLPAVTGTVAELAPPKGEEAWNRAYEQPRYSWYYSGQPANVAPAGGMLVLETERGRSYIPPSRIAYLEAKGAGAKVKQRRPVLLLSVDSPQKQQATIVISYLTKGIAWAPSYQVDTTDPKTLELRQNAVVKNELADLEDVEIRLISGFPSVQFAHVTSPLSPRTSWSQFFNQLNQQVGQGHSILSNAITQQRASFNEPGPTEGLDLSATPAGEGVDLHYESIGRRTLNEGDSLALEVASGKATYERIVEWIVPDTRDAYGRYIADRVRQNDPDKYDDAAWDAVRFKNPLPFAMTTAPAMIVSGGRFNGQQMSYWVNAGEQTTLRVTKALSIRTRSVEHEEKGQRENFWIGGGRYHQTIVRGELTANNHRDEAVSLVIRRRFSGELLSADKDPNLVLLEEGVYAANKRNQLTWNVKLAPGEEVKLEYRYSVWVLD